MGGDRLELKEKCNGGVDRISNLPDEILVDIISLVSLKEAISTSVLSSRWSDLWKRIPTLNLDTRVQFKGVNLSAQRSVFIDWANSVCDHHDVGSLQRLRIQGEIENSEQHAVSKWVEYAASCKRLEALELELLCYGGQEYRAVLEEEVVSRVNYKCLKELRLVGFRVGGEAVKLLLENTPVLERLIIQKATLTSDVEVRSGSLKHLDTLYCQGGRSIKVVAPNLGYLRGSRNSHLLLLENVPRLVEANVGFATQQHGGSVQRFATALFGCFSQLQTLTLNLHSPKAYLASTFPNMPRLKKLKVIYAGKYNEGLIPVTRFIWASPFLEEFHLEWYKFSVPEVEVPMNMARPRLSHQHLKVLEISRFVYDERIEDLVDFILNGGRGCIALEKINMLLRKTNGDEYSSDDDVKERLQPKLPPHVQLLVKLQSLSYF